MHLRVTVGHLREATGDEDASSDPLDREHRRVELEGIRDGRRTRYTPVGSEARRSRRVVRSIGATHRNGGREQEHDRQEPDAAASRRRASNLMGSERRSYRREPDRAIIATSGRPVDCYRQAMTVGSTVRPMAHRPVTAENVVPAVRSRRPPAWLWWSGDVTGVEIAIALVAVLVGALTKSVTGMGFPLVAIPVISLFVSVEDAVVVIALPNVVMNLVLCLGVRSAWSETRDLPVLAVSAASSEPSPGPSSSCGCPRTSW